MFSNILDTKYSLLSATSQCVLKNSKPEVFPFTCFHDNVEACRDTCTSLQWCIGYGRVVYRGVEVPNGHICKLIISNRVCPPGWTTIPERVPKSSNDLTESKTDKLTGGLPFNCFIKGKIGPL